MASKIKQGDNVIVISGKDRGRKGVVVRVAGDRVYVEGINMVKKHVKPNPQRNQPGGIIEQEASVHISNLAILASEQDKPTRVGFKFLEDGSKVRYKKSDGNLIDI